MNERWPPSGHIAGVVNPPAGGKRNYWTSDMRAANPDDWLASSTSHPGSWWPHWYRWLDTHAGAKRAAPSECGNAEYPPLGPAVDRIPFHSTREGEA